MMSFLQRKTRHDQVFSHTVRTLSVNELEKVVGGRGGFTAVNSMKGISAQDNQVKCMAVDHV